MMHKAFAKKGLVGCIGAIGCTHIGIQQPSIESYEDYYCFRKAKFSINVQAVADSRGYFWDVVVGWPGHAHDARILRQSKLWELAE